jgi:quercetin dioxygenase-like cupin family protein
MADRTIENPVSGERVTFIECSRQNAGTRTVAEIEVTPEGGVPIHQHADHQESIDVLEGEIEIEMDGVVRRYGAGEQIVIEPGTTHRWRNASAARKLRFRAAMSPGHPGFETFLRVWFGLGREGALRPNGIPRRLQDLALLGEWDPSIYTGAKRLAAPLLRWVARRPSARARAAELLQRYA